MLYFMAFAHLYEKQMVPPLQIKVSKIDMPKIADVIFWVYKQGSSD